MLFQIETPTRAYLDGTYTEAEFDALKKELTYTNTAASYDVKRHYANMWFRRKNPQGWQQRLEALKALVKNTLVFDEGNRHYIRPSSLSYMELEHQSTEPLYKFPKIHEIAWKNKLPFELHPYQKESVENLLSVKHGNVELCTGSGKSAILLMLAKKTGFRTVVVAPSEPIFAELVEKFQHHLGGENVGIFGDGKKKIGKLVMVCIDDSIVNVQPGTPEWDFFSSAEMLCVDESHTWGAGTLEAICHGVFANVPYRFFMSGTQTRTDGGEMLLHSIIGPTVQRLSTADAIRGGYICNHDYTIVDVESSNPNLADSDPLKMKRVHYLNNRNIASFIAKFANNPATGQILVLVEELSQIKMLAKMLTVPYAVAHSEKRKARLEELGLEKVVPKEQVERFNRNEVKVLIGTSCIATGTNIYPMQHTFNWVGGGSEIKTKQGSVGRSVRLGNQNPWASKCAEKVKVTIWDFNVHDIPAMVKSLKERILFYRESETEIRRIRL